MTDSLTRRCAGVPGLGGLLPGAVPPRTDWQEGLMCAFEENCTNFHLQAGLYGW